MDITLTNDRPLQITRGESRNSVNWQIFNTTIAGLYSALSECKKSSETMAEYLAMSKEEQTRLKDVGGFIGGKLNGTRRLKNCIESRSVITLDADNMNADTAKELIGNAEKLACSFAIYSTRKHRAEAPRLRVLIPTDRDMTPDEYGAVSRWIANKLGMETMDPTTFDLNRLMYWPSCCRDTDYFFKYADSPLLQVNSILNSYVILYGSWQNIVNWPRHPSETRLISRAEKQQDPDEKNGPIGIFNRLYRFERANAEILSGIYEPTDLDDRYTYTKGSTAGGAIVYDDGKFLFSHHATDPASNKNCNMFDLCRLHLFGDQDSGIQDGTPTSQLPSYKKMLEYIKALPDVQEEMSKELAEEAKNAFSSIVQNDVVDENNLKTLASYSCKDISLEVVKAALKASKCDVRVNEISGQTEVIGLPNTFSPGNALNTLPILLKDILKSIKIKGAYDLNISGYLQVIADENRYNPVKEMLQSGFCDGPNRLEELYDILGLTDSFEKTLVKKWLIQCVALAFNDDRRPIGADGALVLQGPQGCGKTEFFRRLAVRPEWFCEGLSLDMGVKDSVIKSTSCWICELGELDSTTRREQSALKAHLTAATDNVRAPYARAATRSPRRTSFCGTVNPEQFLTDSTGNRRFWVVQVSRLNLSKLLSLNESWFEDLWAQIYVLWKNNKNGFRLNKEELETLTRRNKQYETALPCEEEIRRLLADGLDNIPTDQWEIYSASEIRHLLVLYGVSGNVTTQQIGRALTKIVEEYPAMKKFETGHHLTAYLLPLHRAKNPT